MIPGCTNRFFYRWTAAGVEAVELPDALALFLSIGGDL